MNMERLLKALREIESSQCIGAMQEEARQALRDYEGSKRMAEQGLSYGHAVIEELSGEIERLRAALRVPLGDGGLAR